MMCSHRESALTPGLTLALMLWISPEAIEFLMLASTLMLMLIVGVDGTVKINAVLPNNKASDNADTRC